MRSSLRGKISGLIVLLAVSIVTGVGWTLTAARKREGRSELERKALIYSQLMSKQLESVVAFDDHQTARELFASLLLDEDVSSVAVYASDGKLIAGRGQVPAVLTPAGPDANLQVTADWIEATAAVVSHEGPWGTVRVRVSTQRLRSVQDDAFRLSAVVTLAAILVAVAFAWLIAGIVVRRLHRIAVVATRVAKGDLTQPELELEPGALDEIGHFTLAFNAMLKHLRQLMTQARQAADSEQDRLTQLVDKRTTHLNLRNVELEDSREQYRLIAESTSAIPWQYQVSDGCFSYVGPQAEKLLGYPLADWRAPRFLSSILHEEDRERTLAESAAGFAAGGNFEIEFRVTAADGRVVSLRCVATAGQTCLRGLFLDVTLKKKLEGELAQAQKLESIGRLAAGVAHEINTPVQYASDSVHFFREGWGEILGLIREYQALREAVANGTCTPELAAGLLAREQEVDLPYLSENMADAASQAMEGLKRVAEIVRSMKSFSHVDSNGPVDNDLNAGIRSTLAVARSEYKYVADLETHLGKLPWVRTVPSEINQVLLNLIVNAAQAITEVRQQRGRGKITVSTAVDGTSVVVKISDNGAGIADSIRHKVFEQFFTTKSVGKGTGQGLATARAVILRHHGDLSFESKAGVGTTFTIRLPVPDAGVGAAA